MNVTDLELASRLTFHDAILLKEALNTALDAMVDYGSSHEEMEVVSVLLLAAKLEYKTAADLHLRQEEAKRQMLAENKQPSKA